MKQTVTARCINCYATREIQADEVPANDVPCCHVCYVGAMVPVRATSSR
jgi:hypothetical protein